MDVQELATRVEALERRLRAVEDVDAIRCLKARYAELVDARYTRAGPRPPAGAARRSVRFTSRSSRLST